LINSSIESFFLKLQQFSSLLDKALLNQIKIDKLIHAELWESLEFMVLNRDRLYSVIEKQQNSLYVIFEHHKNRFGIDSETQLLMIAWQNDTATWIERMKIIDEKTLVSLKKHKTKTTLQISQLFKSKQAHRGYSRRK